MDRADDVVIRFAGNLPAGKALDLACGTGRNALWLAERGWDVTAVDSSVEAIDSLKSHASGVDARIADLEKGEFEIDPGAWDLVLIMRYLQRDLFALAKLGLKPSGVLIASVLLEDSGAPHARFRAKRGELRRYFEDFEILHYNEEGPGPHRFAEITARRPSAPQSDAR
jgi:SAM-dependent methyltransferase